MALWYPSTSAGDPPWVQQIKRWMQAAVEYINALPSRGDGRTVQVNKGVFTALPQFYPAKITGVLNANGYYPCSVYLQGTSDADPKTSQLMLLWNMDVLGTDVQGFYLVRPIVVTIGATDTLVWEAINPLPHLPDSTNNYGLMSIAGKVRWVWAGACGVTTTTTTTAP
jgi:hypothetical protein